MSDLDSTRAVRRGRRRRSARLGVTGFCWGGRIVWLYSAHIRARDSAGVAWYGPLAGRTNASDARSPHRTRGAIASARAGSYGGLDKSITAADIEQMRAALKAAGKTDCRIDVFADAAHGFFADYRPSYNAKDAQEGWMHCLSWMRTHGVG